PPGAQHRVDRYRRPVLLGAADEVATPQAKQGCLYCALRESRAIRNVCQAQTDLALAARFALGREVEIDQEGRWRAVVADQVTQQHVDNVTIHAEGGSHAMASDAIAVASILEGMRAVS